MTMANDPTTTPSGEADMPQIGKSGRGRPTQNLDPAGEVDQAIGAVASAASSSLKEARTFLDKDKAKQMADKAKDSAAETLSALTDRVNAVRDQVQQSADAARDWAKKQAGSAAEAAKQLHAERPVLVISVSAATALVVGLTAGFIIGRATADEY
jgi:ElaB/YqjD/DUF883 family membrane-anchored ribosome-binding protein